MEMSCAAVKEMLPAYSRDGDGSLAIRRHLSRCSDCNAELTRYEELLGSLATMTSATIEPPAGLKASLVAIPTHTSRIDTVRSHLSSNRKAYLSGAAVLAAGAAGAALWRARSAKPATA